MISTNTGTSFNQAQKLILSPQDKIFIDLVSNRITIYGQIPYNIPERLIVDIIKESARLFYRWYFKATSRIFLRLPSSEIRSFLESNNVVGYESQRGYDVTLPSYVNVVYEIHEANKQNWALAEKVIETQALAQRGSPYGQSIQGINSQLYIIESCVSLIQEQNLQSIFGVSVPFHYNNLTHVLNIGKDVITTQSNLMLEVLANVDVQLLYNDDLFIRHVIGRCKQELKRLIGGHTIELPGGVTLNADEICNNLEDVQAVEDALKAGGGIGDIIMMRG